MTPGFHLHHLAERQLLRIYAFTRDKWGEAQAEKYLAGFHKALNRLAAFPQMGTATYPGSAVLKMVYEQHTIFYRDTPWPAPRLFRARR